MERKPNKLSVELFAHCKSSMKSTRGESCVMERIVCRTRQKNRPRALGTLLFESISRSFRSSEVPFCKASIKGPCESRSSNGEQAPCKRIQGGDPAIN